MKYKVGLSDWVLVRLCLEFRFEEWIFLLWRGNWDVTLIKMKNMIYSGAIRLYQINITMQDIDIGEKK